MKTRQVSEFKETEIGKIPSDWDLKELKQIADVIDPHPSHRAPKEVSIGFPFAGIGDIDEDGTINVDKARKINEEYVKQQEESYEINDYSIGYGRVGTVGKIVKLKKKEFRYALSPTLAVINPNNQIDKIFLNFAIRTESFANQVYSRMTGTTRPALGIQELRKILVIYPPIKEQRSIGKILDDLTNKIQNLQNQNKIIEQIIQSLFKSWFIDFDGVTEFEDSELGKIPKGWKIHTLDDLKSSNKNAIATGPFGSSLKTDEYVKSGVPLIRGKNLRMGILIEDEFIFITNTKADELQSSNVFRNDVLITSHGNIGAICIIPENSNFNRYVISANMMKFSNDPSKITNSYVYFYLKSDLGQNELLGSTTNTGVPHIAQPTQSLKRVPIIVPPFSLLEKFEQISRKIFLEIKYNNKLIQNIQNIRDSLLPKLMSGEIKV